MTGSRLAWADVARGAAMMLVVLAHTLQLMEIGGWDLGWLDTLNLYLTAIRMPLFFLIAGVFGARAVQRTWAGLWASRLALLVYMYFLWMLIRAVWFTFVPWPLGDLAPWLALAVSPFWPTNGLWFLYALVLYLVVGRLTARWPAWIPLTAAGLLSAVAASDLLPTGGNPVWRSIALYLFFFLLGARFADVWKALAARSNLLLLLASIVAVPAGIVVFGFVPDISAGVARVLLSVVCVCASIVVAAMVARARPLAAPFIGVGRRTLPIYVTHTLLLAVLVPLVPVAIVPPAIAAVVLTSVAILLSLLLYLLLGRFSGIYSLPAPVQRRLRAPRRDSVG